MIAFIPSDDITDTKAPLNAGEDMEGACRDPIETLIENAREILLTLDWTDSETQDGPFQTVKWMGGGTPGRGRGSGLACQCLRNTHPCIVALGRLALQRHD